MTESCFWRAKRFGLKRTGHLSWLWGNGCSRRKKVKSRSWMRARSRSAQSAHASENPGCRLIMPELSPQERLQPALLDRLLDNEPEKKLEPREARVMTKASIESGRIT